MFEGNVRELQKEKRDRGKGNERQKYVKEEKRRNIYLNARRCGCRVVSAPHSLVANYTTLLNKSSIVRGSGPARPRPPPLGDDITCYIQS